MHSAFIIRYVRDILVEYGSDIALAQHLGAQLATGSPTGEAQPIGEEHADADDDEPATVPRCDYRSLSNKQT